MPDRDGIDESNLANAGHPPYILLHQGFRLSLDQSDADHICQGVYIPHGARHATWPNDQLDLLAEDVILQYGRRHIPALHIIPSTSLL